MCPASAVVPIQMGPGTAAGPWLGIVWLVVWALILAGVVYAVVRLVVLPLVEGTEIASGADDEALATLRQRFANGALDEAEFERRREVLRREGGEE